MTRRLVGLGLLLAAALVYVGLTLPARVARDEARAAFARQREERERLRAEVARLERRASVGAPGRPRRRRRRRSCPAPLAARGDARPG